MIYWFIAEERGNCDSNKNLNIVDCTKFVYKKMV